MDRKDKLGLEIKSIMDEDTKEINLSKDTLNKILNHREKRLIDKIKDFLNREIEIPLAPAFIGFAALLIVTSIPKDIFKNERVKVIDMGSSQAIIRERQVSRR